MISDLIQRGYNYREIAADIGISEGNVRALLSNPMQQPRWAVGDKLITLHKRAMRKRPKIK